MKKPIEEEFVDRIQQHYKIIHKVIGLYIDKAEDREDLFQEVLLQAWKSYPNFKGQAEFSTWLYKVALNTVLKFCKKPKTEEGIPLEKLQNVDNSPREDYEYLHTCIQQLEPIDRMLMTLHLDGYKNKEIAELTGMTQNHINVKIHRIKSKVVEQLKSVYQ